MGSSEGNKINDGIGFQLSEPSLCANGCGFFGAAATMGLCSKCYRDSRIEEERAASAKATVKKLLERQESEISSSSSSSSSAVDDAAAEREATEESTKPAVAAKNRCMCCNKKVGILGFQCRCGGTYCGVHRYAEKHGCTFDFKGQGKEAIARANPVVKADKVDRI